MKAKKNQFTTTTNGRSIIGRDLSNACQFELLETRTMMSAAPANPSALNASDLTLTSIHLNWTDNATGVTGYDILRSTDDVNFSQIGEMTSPTATNYIDPSVAPGQKYYYEIEAVNGSVSSTASNAGTVTSSLHAPAALIASLSGSFTKLSWKESDSTATGFLVYRSTDDTNFTLLATINSSSQTTFTDSTVAPSTTYYYEVMSFNTLATSPASRAVSVTTPAPAGNVQITTRYGDELVITANDANDTISITETNSVFTIDANGTDYTDSATAGGLFVYTRGTDLITLSSSDTSLTTLDTISGTSATITSAGSDVIAWINSTDNFTGTGTVNRVTSFADGVSKAVGVSMANPTDSGTVVTINASLFGTGPIVSDVNQGSAGDCYFLSSLAAIAEQNPSILTGSAVDMGDGTYAVKFMTGSTPTFIRVSNQFPAGYFSDGLLYAHPGTDGSIWAAVFEKAFAYFRTGAITYASTNSGWMGEAYSDFGISSTAFLPTSYTDVQLYTMLETDLTAGDEITACTPGNAPNLVTDHAYTILSVSDVNGTISFTVRNPWGVSGDSLESSTGVATITYAQFTANFEEGCVS